MKYFTMIYADTMKKKIGLLVLLLALTISPITTVANNDQLKIEFDNIFNEMLNDPANIELTMKYANLAIELEDYEAAIPPLERLLLFNPNLPRIKQEIGVLYYRLNSFDMAKSYLEDSKKGNNVPQDVLKLANEYLSKIK